MKVVELKTITKHFGNITANDSVDFDLNTGEIHAILGENGAGKSTSMNILSGLYQPDWGDIVVRGEKRRFRSPRDAINAGIGMIHQHFMLIQSLTALDNIILGKKLPVFLNRKNLSLAIIELCDTLNFHISLDARISQLSIGEQQRVEIIKALYHGADILILDEPTSVLTPQESDDLFGILRSMRNVSIIFISHKLNEVLSIADRITVMRRGKVVGTLPNINLSAGELAKAMIGRNVSFDHRISEKVEGKQILELKNVKAKNDKGLLALDDVSLELKSGEILGVAGVSGNGQLELAEAINGLRKVESGSVFLDGEDITDISVGETIKKGVAYIPEDRTGMGLIQNFGIIDNMLLKCHKMPLIGNYAAELAEKYAITYSSLNSPVRNLSGGNQQKLILARELRNIPKLLVAAYPTRGLDVGAIEYVREVIADCRDKGSAILLISEDLDELIAISDRIAVLYEGRLSFVPDKDIHEIGLAMAGYL